MTPSEPYRDTSVPVERSKQQIRNALKGAGKTALYQRKAGTA